MDRVGKKSKFIATAFAVLIFAIIVGYAVSTRFNYNLLATVSTIFTAGIFLAAIYTAFFVEEDSTSASTESSENTEEASETDTPNSSSASSSSEQIGPTAGLRLEQKQIQNELIKVAYEEFEENPFSFMVTYQAQRLVDEVSDRLNVEQSTVSKVIRSSLTRQRTAVC